MGDFDGFDQDTAPLGGGGDPFSDAADDYDPADAGSTGALPGGADGQLSPFSPNGGFDYTDVLGTGFRLASAGATGFLARQRNASRNAFDNFVQPLFGPGGTIVSTGPLKHYLDSPVPDDGSGSPGLLPGETQSARSAAAYKARVILRAIRMNTGMRVTQRNVVNLIIRYGFPAVQGMTHAPYEALTFLFFREKGTVHHHRGPGIYTIAKKMRRHERLMHTVQRVLGRGAHRRRHTHKRYNFHKRRKR